jgi:isopenicillin-N N-acyltransferase-like protein
VRVLDLPPGKSPREWGRIHGESFRGEIRSLAELRTFLCTRVGRFASAEQVHAAAKAHLPVLEHYHKGLYDELVGIAEGAIVAPEDVVIANHYTDLRDLDPEPESWQPAPTHDDRTAVETLRGADVTDGCSVLYAETPARIVAQTWDMHATATPFVMVLGVPENEDGPAARLLTVTGCLGMCGMSALRVAVAINNLFSTDSTLGVVWPAVVRRALHEPTAAAARDAVLTSPIGSGHHYFIADRREAFGIETSGRRRRVVYHRDPDCHYEAPPRYFHTNHCLDLEVGARTKVPETSTTFDRLDALEKHRHDGIDGVDGAWRILGSTDGWPRSVCTYLATPEAPHAAATCGAIAMDLDSGELWAQQGLIHGVEPDKWRM